MKIALETHQLTTGYDIGSSILFSKQDLQLYTGQLVCFMGPNGIGKSTLIKTLAGLQKPLEGHISYGHADIAIPQQVAVVLTDKISANLTVWELIAYGRYPYISWNLKLSEKDNILIDKAIADLSIEHLQNKKIDELSDGQVQLVMIARALVQDTPLILLDEPTAHLDLNNRLEIMNLLKNIAHHSNKSILLATHELDLALQTADLIWLTGDKKNIITGLPEDLVLNGKFDETFQFKGFDLKSGKVSHSPFREVGIKVLGSAYFHLWTKNALERNGYSIDLSANIEIMVQELNGEINWIIQTPDQQWKKTSIQSLLDQLNQITATD